MQFSFDNLAWYPLPKNYGPTVTVTSIRQVKYNPVPMSVELHKDILELSNNLIEVGAPIYHSLLIEAIEQRSDNPRSALIMGTVALETAIKRYISKLLPETAWLLDNVQSPPVFRILRDYIPDLPAETSIDVTVAIPIALRTRIQGGIEVRNKITHTGEIPENSQASKEYQKYRHNFGNALYYFLLAVRDVVWLLDYYGGEEWALDYVSDATLESLGVKGRGTSVFLH